MSTTRRPPLGSAAGERGTPRSGSTWEAHGGTKWDRAARFFRIASVLQGRPDGITAAELAQRVGISKRTAYRDLEAMSTDAGLPIWQDAGRWGLGEDAFLRPLPLTLHEATLLFLAARVMVKVSDEQDVELVGAFVKLADILPPAMAEHVRAAVDAYARTTARNERFTSVFRTLTEAWAGRRVVEIEYGPGVYDPSKPTRRTRVRPYLIEPSALTHALYLIGWDEDRAARRTFKVERILAASLTPETFEPEAGFEAAAELRRAWDIISDEPLETVVVRFSPAVARRVAETRWHPTQELHAERDGSITWQVRVAGLHEVRIWILGWGADAEVVAPPALRDEVAAELRRASQRYGEVEA